LFAPLIRAVKCESPLRGLFKHGDEH